MNERSIEIKEKRNGFLIKGFIYLILDIISLSCALMPYLVLNLYDHKIYFFLFGGAAFVILTILFVLHINSECKPSNAIILSETGYTDYLNIGNYEIEWTNIHSVKLLGNQGSQYLGISLENSDIVIDNVKPKHADTIRYNLEDNLPAIIIDQDNVRIPLDELKELLTKYIKDARKVNQTTPEEKAKNNPFTTEDVLRAFGKIDNIDNNESDESLSEDSTFTSLDTLLKNTDTDDVEPLITEESNGETKGDNSNDFFADLDIFTQQDTAPDNPTQAQNHSEAIVLDDSDTIQDENNTSNNVPELDSSLIFISIDESPDVNNKEDDTAQNIKFEIEQEAETGDINNEIQNILSRAKSTKISEIEKILADKEVPFSLSRSIPLDESESTAQNDVVEFNIKSINQKESNHNEDFNSSLDDLIRDALNDDSNVKANTVPNDSAYPDLVIFDND